MQVHLPSDKCKTVTNRLCTFIAFRSPKVDICPTQTQSVSADFAMSSFDEVESPNSQIRRSSEEGQLESD